MPTEYFLEVRFPTFLICDSGRALTVPVTQIVLSKRKLSTTEDISSCEKKKKANAVNLVN